MDIIKIITSKLRLEPNIDYREIVKLTPGYVGADISTLCKEASILAVERIINNDINPNEEDDKELENIFI